MVLVTAPVSTYNRWCNFYDNRVLVLLDLLRDTESGNVDRDSADTAEEETGGTVLLFVSM